MRTLLSNIARINDGVAAFCVSVSDATLTEWNEYQESDYQELRSSYMEWIDGKIYIVELPTTEHAYYAFEFQLSVSAQPAARAYLKRS
ncbi:hypothetical protein JG687_00006674 [Phytophthora cactorum]|uniref:Uncharacterized protein n=1 Tax=Phytophthora cactorum TaxID=29920 RepID=A0A8T1UIR0_9STRA|nr:hypothetical protein GQ600_85 [Phytophthora cactorum]KAG6963273.1 hypothetical protein JG687_00006674 [Phytophthora cactorum]